MGAELCLAHDMGGVEAYGGPLSVDMQPYGCFIILVFIFVIHFHITAIIFKKFPRYPLN